VVFGSEPALTITLEVVKYGEPCINIQINSVAASWGQPDIQMLVQRCPSIGNRVIGELSGQGNFIKFSLNIAAGERMVFGESSMSSIVTVIRRTE
jgi:hypothetical protein